METITTEKLNTILNDIKNNINIIEKTVEYLQNNNLLEDLYSKIYYSVEKTDPIYKIKYYKNPFDGSLLSISDVINNNSFVEKNLESCTVYVYDEIKRVYFKNEEIGKEVFRCQEPSKSYEYSYKVLHKLNKDNDFENVNWTKLIIDNPLLFIYIILEYNIDIEKLNIHNEESFTYKKEIKNN